MKPVSRDIGDITCVDRKGLHIAIRPYDTDLYWGWWAYPSCCDTLSGSRNSTALAGYDLTGYSCPSSPYYFGAGPLNVYDGCSQNQLWSNHTRGGNFALADGSDERLLQRCYNRHRSFIRLECWRSRLVA